jgi:hypothetical protein
MVFQPISHMQRTIHPVLLYVENFTFGGRKAVDSTHLEEEDVDMYLLWQKFRSQVSLSNGERKCMGDVIPITSVTHTVDLIPVFGAQKDPQITANNTLEYPTKFYLNNFSDKEVYHTVLREFT